MGLQRIKGIGRVFDYSVDSRLDSKAVQGNTECDFLTFEELEKFYLAAKEVNDRLKGEKDATTT